MDYPHDIRTNAHRIEDIKEIHWARYTRKQEGEEFDGVSANIEHEKAQDPPEIVALRLYAQGNHILFDKEKSIVWIFCLSELEKENGFHVLDSNAFECLDSGCISASDLSVLPGLITTTPRANDATHISKEHAGGAKDPAVQSTDGNVSLTLRDLYEKITASLSQSICYLLARERHFLQIGSPTCLDARTLGDSAFDVLDVGSLQPESITMTCKVQWLSSGSLWIYLSMDPIVRLCTVRHALQKLGESAKLIEGDAILLSPSGLVGQYHGMEKTPRSHPSYGLVTSVKSRISAWLTQREEQLDDGTQWVYVSFGGNCARGISKKSLAHEVKRTFSLWPAHLCLCRDASSATVMPSESLCVDPSNDSLGPLERAQAWFLGKDARKEAIEADQCREIAEAARSSAVDDLDEDDLMTSPRYHVSQGVTPQDLTGIYPTPPDGIPPIVHDAFTNFNSQQDSITDRPTTAIADEDVDRQGGRPGNEELFGGMDIDTFATNGLTEDDFNFFDEPDIIIHDDNNFGVDRSPIATPMAAGTAVQMTDKDVTSPYDIASVRQVANPDSSCEVPDVGQHLSLVLPDSSGDTSTEAAVTVVPASSNKFLCDKDIINMLDEGDKDGVVEDAVPKYSPFQKDTLLPDYRQLRERSFGNVYFPDLASTFDEKYALSGRYGFSPPNLPDPSTSLQKSIRVPNGPPESGVTDPEESRLRSQMSTDRALTQLGHANWTNTTQSVGDTDEEDYTPPSPRSSDSDNEEATQTLLERPHDTMSWTSSEDDRRPVTPLSSGPAPKTSEQPKLLDPFQEEILCFPDNNEQVHVYLKAHLGSAMTEASPVGRNDRNFVQVAQMVVDQAISRVNRPQDSDHHRSMQDLQAAHSSQLLHQIIATWSSRFGKNSKQCSLKDFLCLDGQDLQSSTRDQEMMKKPLQPIRPSAAGQTVTKLPSPFTCVQRSGTHIDIAAPALRFWEELSLAPCHDSKDVVAFCLYPTGLCIQDELHTFLAMMRSTYQSCKLGIHELGCGPSKFPDGLVPLPMDVRNPNYDLPEIYQACEDFGSWLGKLGLQGRNIIVYMLDPLDNGAAAPLLCAAFLRIFNMYSKVIKDDGNGEPSDLVLQIVPSRIVYSEVGIAIASPLDYRKLAFEVYDRCGPSKCDGKDATQSFVGAPSMRLAKAVPRAIDLRLTPDNAPLSLQSDKCLHIAYAWSPGEPWLTASWIDNLGLLSWTACYGFGDEDSVLWRSFSEIANEIWQTTLELLQPRSGPWRLLLCKDGAVHKQELDAWQSVVSTSGKPPTNLPVHFTFLSIEVDPLLQLPSTVHAGKSLDLPLGSLETPENTPHTNIPSPDIGGLGSTPGGPVQVSTPPPNNGFGEHDPDARLIDITDETWGVVMTRDMNDACTPSDLCTVLASGYLLKRGGPRDDDGVVHLGVNVIRGQKPYRQLLKVVLGLYRNLGLLARAREIVDPLKGIEPYHVAAVRKAHTAVNTTMQYEDG